MTSSLVPSIRLVRCSACTELIKSQERACPHCGVVVAGGGAVGTVVTAAVASLMMGCPVALYGAPATESGSEMGTVDDSDETLGGTRDTSGTSGTDALTTTTAPTSGTVTEAPTGTGTTLDTDGTGTDTDTATDGTSTAGPNTTALYGVAAT